MFLKVLLISLGLYLVACRHVPFYRKDYTYFDEFDAFYKLHSDGDGTAWTTALFSCENEGSQLFYPKAPEEWKIVQNLLEAKGLPYNFTDIYVGIKNEGIEEFLTVDGLGTPSPLANYNHITGDNLCTTMDLGDGSLKVEPCAYMNSTAKPYVCKKVEDISCPTIDRGYTYVKETKKCYKVNKLRQNWHNALNTCVMEGGLLVNIESEIEVKFLEKLITKDEYYHVGFRNIPPSHEFYTIKGQSMRVAYEKNYDSNRKCGALMSTGYIINFMKVGCSRTQEFICEMDVSA